MSAASDLDTSFLASLLSSSHNVWLFREFTVLALQYSIVTWDGMLIFDSQFIKSRSTSSQEQDDEVSHVRDPQNLSIHLQSPDSQGIYAL